MVAQAPALFETLAGVKIADLFARVPALQTPRTDVTPTDKGESR